MSRNADTIRDGARGKRVELDEPDEDAMLAQIDALKLRTAPDGVRPVDALVPRYGDDEGVDELEGLRDDPELGPMIEAIETFNYRDERGDPYKTAEVLAPDADGIVVTDGNNARANVLAEPQKHQQLREDGSVPKVVVKSEEPVVETLKRLPSGPRDAPTVTGGFVRPRRWWPAVGTFVFALIALIAVVMVRDCGSETAMRLESTLPAMSGGDVESIAGSSVVVPPAPGSAISRPVLPSPIEASSSVPPRPKAAPPRPSVSVHSPSVKPPQKSSSSPPPKPATTASSGRIND